MNKVVLVGRLTRDPELRFTPGTGKAVATFTLAVNRRFKTPGQPEADFISVVVWGKTAENTANYVGKGKLIGVGGTIQTRSYDAKDGTKRYVVEVVADEVQFLEPKGQGQSVQASTSNNNYSSEFSGYEDDITPIDDGDIPF